jgi:hypothetical protein
VDKTTVLLREAFDSARMGRYDLAAKSVQMAIGMTNVPAIAGYLKQQLAEYTNFLNPVAAQEIQIAAINLNHRVLRPLIGASYSKLTAPASGQAAAAATFMSGRFLQGNDLVIFVNGLLEDLRWGEEHTRRFEAAMRDLGIFLGFGSQRPEQDIGKGPDNLWAVGDLSYFIIECKSGTTSDLAISKRDTNQLNGSIVWFEQTYDASCKFTPILVHPKVVFEFAASPDPAVRIVNETSLSALKEAVRSYSTALASGGTFKDAKEVDRQLRHHKLDAKNILRLMTVSLAKK